MPEVPHVARGDAENVPVGEPHSEVRRLVHVVCDLVIVGRSDAFSESVKLDRVLGENG